MARGDYQKLKDLITFDDVETPGRSFAAKHSARFIRLWTLAQRNGLKVSDSEINELVDETWPSTNPCGIKKNAHYYGRMPSDKALIAAFKITPQEALEIRMAMLRQRGLGVANRILKGFGVERIGLPSDQSQWQHGWPDHSVDYVNMGDTYSTTLLKVDGKYVIGNWGAYVEKWDTAENPCGRLPRAPGVRVNAASYGSFKRGKFITYGKAGHLYHPAPAIFDWKPYYWGIINQAARDVREQQLRTMVLRYRLVYKPAVAGQWGEIDFIGADDEPRPGWLHVDPQTVPGNYTIEQLSRWIGDHNLPIIGEGAPSATPSGRRNPGVRANVPLMILNPGEIQKSTNEELVAYYNIGLFQLRGRVRSWITRHMTEIKKEMTARGIPHAEGKRTVRSFAPFAVPVRRNDATLAAQGITAAVLAAAGIFGSTAGKGLAGVAGERITGYLARKRSAEAAGLPPPPKPRRKAKARRTKRNPTERPSGEYRETGIYSCPLGHQWQLQGVRFSPFESRPCPKCGSAGKLETVISVKAKKNPGVASLSPALRKYASQPGFMEAVARYKKFHGVMPTSLSWHRLPMGSPKQKVFMAAMGEAPAESYRTTKNMRGSNKANSTWVHKYEGKPPMKAVSGDGKLIVTLPGKHRVTDWIRG